MAETARSLCVIIPREISHDFTRKLLISSLYKLIKADLSHVEYISQQFNNFTWRITFKKEYSCSKFIGKHLSISDREVVIQDFTEVSDFKFVTYKVLWLPHEFKVEAVKKYFADLGAIVTQITEESFKEKIDDLPLDFHIKNGNILVKIKVKRDSEGPRIESGIHTILSNKSFINKVGEKPKCLKCHEVGHIRKNCPKNSILCTKCNKTGHTVLQCNMALATKLDLKEHPDEHENDDTLNENLKNLSQITDAEGLEVKSGKSKKDELKVKQKYEESNSEEESEGESMTESEKDSIDKNSSENENKSENIQKKKIKKRKKSDDNSIKDQSEVKLIRTDDIDALVKNEMNK